MDVSLLDTKTLQSAALFPYLSTGKKIIQSQNNSLETIPPVVSQIALSYLRQEPFSEESTDKSQLVHRVMAYPLAKLYLLVLKNHSLMERFADYFAAMAWNALDEKSLASRNQKEMDIYLELGIPFEPTPNPQQIILPLANYLNIPKRRLAKRLIDLDIQDGFVILSPLMAKELATDFVRHHILSSFQTESFDPKSVPPAIHDQVNQFSRELLAAQREKFAQLSGPVRVNAFPPCMAELYARLASGENLNHLSRFNLAVFLLNINMPEEEIVSLFSKAPNFDEKKTRYHLKSLVKDGKPYSLSNCETLRGHQLCIQNGALCPGIVNPLQYYRKSAASGKPLVENAPEGT